MNKAKTLKPEVGTFWIILLAFALISKAQQKPLFKWAPEAQAQINHWDKKEHLYLDGIKYSQIVLHNLKEKSILFWFDSSKKKYYKSLKIYISNINSFSEVKSSNHWQVSFKKLGDGDYCLDLAINWDTDCKSVMFSTWIYHVVQNKECMNTTEIIVSNQPYPGKRKKKSKKKSKKNRKQKEVALPKVDTRLISSQKSLQKTDTLHLQSQHSSQVTIPSVPHVQTVDTSSLKHEQTEEKILSNQSNTVTFATMPKKASKKKSEKKEIVPQKADTHAIASQKPPQKTISLHIQSQHPSLVMGNSVPSMQTDALHFQSQSSSLDTVTFMPSMRYSNLRFQPQPSSVVTIPLVPPGHLASLNFPSQASSLVTVPSMSHVNPASLPIQLQQLPLVTVPSVPIRKASNFQNESRIPWTHRSITPFAASLPYIAPPQAFNFQSNLREMTRKQPTLASTSQNEGYHNAHT